VRRVAESFVKNADVPAQRFLAIDVDWGADFISDFAKGNTFAMQFHAAVFKVVHEAL
jgi:imidazoleglycerol phosphate synthase glutamine amidotransferase subunit HisH